MKLRDYQQRCHDAVFADLAEYSSALVVAPTGSGKTILFGTVARDWSVGRILIVAHRDELIRQAADKVGRICGETCAIEMGGERSNESSKLYRARVVVTSVQTMSRDSRLRRFDPDDFGLVIIDEAHHAVAESYLKVWGHFRQNPRCKLLGVTATPDRADEEALGRVFETVSFEYGIKDAIDDGWLVPVKQQLVWVDGLDFSMCRTTAGDLNQGDLAKIMEMEKALHGVVAPTMEIAAGRKTLVFTASVGQAERGAEIANRHRPGCAEWISGTTPMDSRRDTLRRYADGEFQFLFNCAIALEGFDEPGIQVVAMARPTKSRALYAQAIGRGTRPLAGTVDGLEPAERRRLAISTSPKPSMLVLDFVGNAGRHKLIHATDVLGVEYEDQWLDDALAEIEKRSKAGLETDVEDAFRAVADQREKARQKAELEEQERERAAAEREAAEQAAGRRKGLVAKVQYGTRAVDPFGVFDITPAREAGWDRAKRPTERMLGMLRNAGLPEPELERLNMKQAGQLIAEVKRRWAEGICTFKQAAVLKKYGYNGDATSAEAGRIITQLKANGWKRLPAGVAT